MKVLNLQCTHQHSFEGWFASEDDFQSQLVRGLVECPMCADKGIQKMPSAPRLNFGAQQAASNAKGNAPVVSTASVEEASSSNELVASASSDSGAGPSNEQQAAFLKALRHIVAHTEDVGDKFASQARRMHYGEEEARNIRGQASPREAIELIEEGIAVMPLPLPAALKETLQ
jgi:hypothetical protein